MTFSLTSGSPLPVLPPLRRLVLWALCPSYFVRFIFIRSPAVPRPGRLSQRSLLCFPLRFRLEEWIRRRAVPIQRLRSTEQNIVQSKIITQAMNVIYSISRES